MRELRQILTAFEQLASEKIPSALATVIAVGGSSYRRPGARMLIAGDGRTWGGISGGCLERDVARRGRGVIDLGQPIICRYDNTETPDDITEDDLLLDVGRTPGATLGCRGVIDLFIERISADSPGPMPLIAKAVRDRIDVKVATLIRRSDSVQMPLGTRILSDGCVFPDNPHDSKMAGRVAEWMHRAPLSKYGAIHNVALSENESADLYIETLRPPQSLILFGGGFDSVPVVELAKTLGWHVTVVANPRSNCERFADADRYAVAHADDPLAGIVPEPTAAVVLMTHDMPRDVRILRSLAGRCIKYLGILGPKSRTERLMAQAPGSECWNTHFPAGLDLGADDPALIALAIISEIQAVLADRSAVPLRDRPGPIYPRMAISQ